ncbi:MAG TPA: DUF5719 family protein [Acidimicrobiales bacterium]|nr:DUF5719 family protein [Acidimicrobiales bacterium]
MAEPVPTAEVTPGRSRRLLVVALVAALLAAAGVADRAAREPKPTARRASAGMPVASPVAALSSSWFCPGGTADASAAADVSVVVVNTATTKATGTLTVVPSQGDPKQVPLSVDPRSRSVVRLGDVVPAAYDAALVDLDQGGVAVEYAISSSASISTAPCASSASGDWYLADGSTERDDSMLLTLFNPFPDDAIVDLSFATDQGRAEPSEFQGIVVKGGRLAVVNVGDHVRRRANIAVTASARTGRFVMGRIQTRVGPPAGASTTLAAPSPAETWYFPDGLVADGVAERFNLYNPSDREAQVEIDLSLDQGSAEPFDLTVPAHDRLTLNAQDEERIPRGVGHSATVRSVNGVAVVAEQTLATGSPAPRTGFADQLGIRAPARRWSFAIGGTSNTVDEWITVQNADPSHPVRLSVTVLAQGQLLAVDGATGLDVPAGGRLAIRLTDHVSRADLPLVVTANGPIAAVRGIYYGDRPGVAISAGIPY